MFGLPRSPADDPSFSAPDPLWRRLARGQILGWIALTIVDALVLDIVAPPHHAAGAGRAGHAALGLRALQHALDAGQALAAGLLSAAAIVAFRRWAPRRFPGWAALAVAAFALGALVLPEDLGGLLARAPGPRELWEVVTIGAAALVIAALAQITLALCTRPRGQGGASLRAVTAALGLLLAVENHLVLQGDYGGLHLFAAWAAAIVLGVTAGFAIPRRLPRRARLALLPALTAAAVCSVAILPRNQVTIALRREMGGSLAPWILRAQRPVGRIVPVHQGAWFVDRRALPPVAPSAPPLLPRDAPVVVLVTLDGARADVLADPAREALFPSLTALRRESVVFTDARSAAPATSASLASLFTGKYFSELYWTPMAGSPLICPHTDPSPRFAEILAARGVATVTFTSLPGLLNDTGIVRGFTEEQLVSGRGTWATADLVAEPLLARLRRQGPGPLFLYVHFADAHAPYNLDGAKGTDFERYLQELSAIDAQVGRIRRALEAPGLAARAALIVSADHGEAFGEHGARFHATTVYDELLRVPLVVHVPGGAARAVAAPVSLLDVGPTVLDLMGAPTPATFMGESLTPYLRGEAPVLGRPIVAESSRGMRAMVFRDGLKVIRDERAGTHEIYDLTTDARELTDLSAERGESGRERLDLLDAFLGAHELRLAGYVAPFVR